jgi:hypothetical protein
MKAPTPAKFFTLVLLFVSRLFCQAIPPREWSHQRILIVTVLGVHNGSFICAEFHS